MDRPAEVAEAGIPVGVAGHPEEEVSVVALLVEEAVGQPEALREAVRLEAAEDPLHLAPGFSPEYRRRVCRRTIRTATTIRPSNPNNNPIAHDHSATSR